MDSFPHHSQCMMGSFKSKISTCALVRPKCRDIAALTDAWTEVAKAPSQTDQHQSPDYCKKFEY